jgi:bile acid:Na+ symporter, BASS family
VIHRITALFPLWALLIGLLAWVLPAPFIAAKPSIVWLLGLIMFSMGLTLRTGNFLEILKRPSLILLGISLQYALMPALAWLISIVLGLPAALMIGMILVGTSPGGTASNVICYLARGDVALSITLTTVSTLLAIIATPLLTLLYAGHSVDIPAMQMLWDILRIVILPVLGGVLINTLFSSFLHRIKTVLPAVSVAAIVIIIGIVIALNHERIGDIGGRLLLAVALHNALGLLLGYTIPRLLGRDMKTARTLAIETGMQNSGLAVALAIKYFTPLSALPGALFSLWHNLTGSLLASYWGRRTRN